MIHCCTHIPIHSNTHTHTHTNRHTQSSWQRHSRLKARHNSQEAHKGARAWAWAGKYAVRQPHTHTHTHTSSRIDTHLQTHRGIFIYMYSSQVSCRCTGYAKHFTPKTSSFISFYFTPSPLPSTRREWGGGIFAPCCSTAGQ